MSESRVELLSAALERAGWVKDRWGHHQKDIKNKDGVAKKRRIVMKQRVVSIEAHVAASEGYPSRWIRVYSAPWSKVKITETGGMIGICPFKFKDAK